MKKAMKAALVSAFVLPGAGHIVLKKYITGAVLIGISLTSVYYLVTRAMEDALKIVEQIQSGRVQPDVAAIMQLASAQSAGAGSSQDIATSIIVVCWVIGIIDSYRAGLKQEKKR